MSLRYFVAIRRLSTSNVVRASILSSEYKSCELWKERFQCPIIRDNETIKVINSKILIGDALSNLELDVFINVAQPSKDDKTQLQEAAKLLSDFRKSLYAHALLPSTHHALCRLFLDSDSLPSLITLLDSRVKYGIFPDFYATNLTLNAAIELESHSLGSKIASLVMLQEDFGLNPITDRLSLLALSQYSESMTDFRDWLDCDPSKDSLLAPTPDGTETSFDELSKEQEKTSEDEDEDEEEEEAEYIRIPFLRNPYFDNHFDISKPRILCGKSLVLLGKSLSKSNLELGLRTELLGSVLQGSWKQVLVLGGKCKDLKVTMGSTKDSLSHYVVNLHDIDAPDDNQKEEIEKIISKISNDGPSLAELAKMECESIGELESRDIHELKSNLIHWSQLRKDIKQAAVDRTKKDKLLAEIAAKKEELKREEDYLFFYDKLRKSRVARIEYD